MRNELVELDERLGGVDVALREGVERDASHSLCARAHVGERVDERGLGIEVGDELHQLGDRDAVVAHPLEVEVRVQEREHEPQVAGDRGLLREQRLNASLDVEVERVDLVVEGDHLVGELVVLLPQRVQCAAQRAEHELALLLQRTLGAVELLLEGDAGHQPKRPVT